MASLPRELRNDLGNKVRDARRIAEAGARKVIESLAVHHHEPWASMSPADRRLRNRLRAHGRQLGDQLDPKRGTQTIEHLVSEVSYEHWHGMLFARFLAENDLLLMPDTTTAITLDEVEEIAKEQGRDWLAVVSEYAEKMLPQIFRSGDPALEVTLPPETRKALDKIIRGLSQQVFTADDSLGWVYQFWQADKKDDVNKSEKKIGADELPAVTQLFTEDYMVLFLLHNTLGAWWAGKVLSANPHLARSGKSEDELRAACKVGNIEWTYLRFTRDTSENGTGHPWRPAAGTFEGWPRAAKDITVLDPCMGSGHFLVFALSVLVALRMAEEGLLESAAVIAVLQDNLFGLEIDPRCTQIAAFNLAFAAWRRVGHCPLPRLNLACSGLTIGVTKAEWLKLAEKAATAADPAVKRDLLGGVEQNLMTVGLEERVKDGLTALYDLFAKAPWLGSLIDPRRSTGDIFREDFEKLEPLLASILAAADTDDTLEMAVAAQGMAKAARTLSSKFSLVITNVPYLGRARQDLILCAYCESEFPLSKSDLATTFNERCFSFSTPGGACAVVCTQNWFYLTQYTKLRRHFLTNRSVGLISRLGAGAFDSIGGEVVSVALSITSPSIPSALHLFAAIDAESCSGIDNKSECLIAGNILSICQVKQVGNPDSRLILEHIDEFPLLAEVAEASHGQGSFDAPRFGACFWEVNSFDPVWQFQQSTPDKSELFGGCYFIFRWEGGSGSLAELMACKEKDGYSSGKWRAGTNQWGRLGVLCGQMGDMPCTMYLGKSFDENASVIIPHRDSDLPAIWAYCSSENFASEIRKIDQSVKVTCKTLVKVPFDISHWHKVASGKYPNGLPAPFSSDSAQWLFDGGPKKARQPLQVGIARLLGYRWPRQAGSDFLESPSVGADGLEVHVAEDGIICLAALKGEQSAEQRLSGLLADAFGAEWSAAKLATLLAEVGYAGKSLGEWLRDGYFAQHCELFHQRPFIWHIWDGRRDGFNALVNYHHLAGPDGDGLRALDKLIYSHLGAWIERQESDRKVGVDGADGRIAAARHLKDELEKIRRGEPPYDIFVRWKSLFKQPKGWGPDINDGVRINIRPFMTARPFGAKAKNACILRSTPRITWDKDRGKEPSRPKKEFPWFWKCDGEAKDFLGGDEFDGARWNDLHYSLFTKEKASEDKGAA